MILKKKKKSGTKEKTNLKHNSDVGIETVATKATVFCGALVEF